MTCKTITTFRLLLLLMVRSRDLIGILSIFLRYSNVRGSMLISRRSVVDILKFSNWFLFTAVAF